MSLLQQLESNRQERKLRRKEKLRVKNDRLRSQGKEPLKGWNTAVNTGTGALNGLTRKYDKGIVDLTGKEKAINFHADEQKRIAEKANRKHKND